MATVLKTLAASYPANNPPTTSWLSLNAEDLPDISEEYDVTAVPFLVLLRNKTVLETVSGSDATKVRSAIEKHANSSSTKPKNVADQIPPLQKVTPKQSNGTATKDLSSSTPSKDDPATAPQYSSEEMAGQKEDLHKRLADLVKAAPVMLFMKGTPSSPQCGFSRQLVALLRENGVRYGFFNILADDEVRQGLKEFADWPTFPQLWVDGELVGGLDIVSISSSFHGGRTKPFHRSRRSWRMIQTFSRAIQSRAQVAQRSHPNKLLRRHKQFREMLSWLESSGWR